MLSKFLRCHLHRRLINGHILLTGGQEEELIHCNYFTGQSFPFNAASFLCQSLSPGDTLSEELELPFLLFVLFEIVSRLCSPRTSFIESAIRFLFTSNSTTVTITFCATFTILFGSSTKELLNWEMCTKPSW